MFVRSRTRQRGSILILMATSCTLLCACLALSLDLGRVYIVRNEAQVFADSAALSAALRLNGSSAGLRESIQAVRSNPNRFNFGTEAFTDMLVEFGPARDGPWSSSPQRPELCSFVRVTARAKVTMMLLPVLNGAATSMPGAVAVAARTTERPGVTLVR